MQDFYAYIPAAAQNKPEAVLAQHPIESKVVNAPKIPKHTVILENSLQEGANSH